MVVEYSCEVEYPWTHRSKPGVQANAEDERAEQIQNIPESELPSMEVNFHGPIGSPYTIATVVTSTNTRGDAGEGG